MSSEEEPKHNPVEDAARKVAEGLSDLFQAQLSQSAQVDKTKNERFVDVVANIFDTSRDEMAEAPERILVGVKDLASRVESILQDNLTNTEAARTRASEATSEILTRMKDNGFDPSAHVGRVTHKLQELAASDPRLDPSHVASGLRTLADAFDGKVAEDDNEAGDRIESLAQALEDMGRSLTGRTREREDAETRARIRSRASKDIEDALRESGYKD
jgi:hypothetical protein